MSDQISLASLEAARREFPAANVFSNGEASAVNSGIKVIKNKASQSTGSVANVAVFEDPAFVLDEAKQKFLRYTCSITITTNADGHDAELKELQAAVIEFISNLHKTL